MEIQLILIKCPKMSLLLKKPLQFRQQFLIQKRRNKKLKTLLQILSRRPRKRRRSRLLSLKMLRTKISQATVSLQSSTLIPLPLIGLSRQELLRRVIARPPRMVGSCSNWSLSTSVAHRSRPSSSTTQLSISTLCSERTRCTSSQMAKFASPTRSLRRSVTTTTSFSVPTLKSRSLLMMDLFPPRHSTSSSFQRLRTPRTARPSISLAC